MSTFSLGELIGAPKTVQTTTKKDVKIIPTNTKRIQDPLINQAFAAYTRMLAVTTITEEELSVVEQHEAKKANTVEEVDPKGRGQRAQKRRITQSKRKNKRKNSQKGKGPNPFADSVDQEYYGLIQTQIQDVIDYRKAFNYRFKGHEKHINAGAFNQTVEMYKRTLRNSVKNNRKKLTGKAYNFLINRINQL